MKLTEPQRRALAIVGQRSAVACSNITDPDRPCISMSVARRLLDAGYATRSPRPHEAAGAWAGTTDALTITVAGIAVAPMTTLSTDLPLPFPGWELDPTPAMTAGDQRCWQCGWCGAVVIVPSPSPADPQPSRTLTGRPCPACCSTAGWWRQDTPDGHTLAGWRFVGDTASDPQNTNPTIGAS